MTISSFFSLYPEGRNALISWTTVLALDFARGVVNMVFVSITSVDVGFEEGHL